MRFSDFEYKRPNMPQVTQQFEALLQEFNAATSVALQDNIITKVNALRSDFDTMMNIAYIRYSIDTTNKAYEEEQNYFDEQNPVYQNLTAAFYRALVGSAFRSDLEEKWGKQLFDIAEVSIAVISDEIIADLQTENKLGSEYTKLTASAKIMFDGKELNLSGLVPYQMSQDRSVRKAAHEARWAFFADNAEKFDNIFDAQVKLRHKIAQKLGFKNFVELGYKRMKRTDYNAEMVAGYRQQVLEVVVPLAASLRERQAKRLGLSGDFKYYDIEMNFGNGNPKPQGDPQWIIEKGKKMYDELSDQTSEFFQFMLDNELMDLVNRKGKAGGGYCTYVDNYKAPFIFSNFNGTSHDINVLTHEAGHAFQVYMSRHFEMPEYHWPTYEACEIHSMSMEFLAWPWMESFFEQETGKFKFEHLSSAILFLPYGVSVDEFQHRVYENPEMTPTERKQVWRNIEKKYQPWINYEGNEFLENGGYWQKQSHIYQMPFYYIDYTLAQICAFQFWKRSNENRSEALSDYIKLCSAGGSQPFLQLVDYANLKSPFDKGCLSEVIKPIEHYLAQVDDSVFA